ncbi:glycosyltransferase family 4 protein [Bariatricus sp. HCP28S3_A7]|uniref:glycosyltransferase family 4 protein n=1 Tax=Bariatricus sp. HCP28S3_A7 TaxID=3438894 RepID=UPI003F8C9BAB
MMKAVDFIGPIDMTMGPGIKNTYTLQNIRDVYRITVLDTRNMNPGKALKVYGGFCMSKKPAIIAVSSRGRSILLPIAYLKKKLLKDYRYVIISINGYLINELHTGKKWHDKAMVNALKCADKIFVEIEGLAKNLGKEGIHNTVWFPNFKPDNDYKPIKCTAIDREKDDGRDIRFVFLARVCRTKGVDMAIRAIKELRKEGYPVCLDIYGPVDEDAKEDIGSLDEKCGVQYCGVLPNAMVTAKLCEYDGFLFPSKHIREGFPASLLDAFSAGLPVVASDISYNSEIVVNGVNGLIFKTGDQSGFETAIRRLLEDKALFTAMGKANYEKSLRFRSSKVFADMKNEMIGLGW